MQDLESRLGAGSLGGSEIALNTGEGAGSDIVPNTTATPFTLNIGDSVGGFVNNPTDQDWYKVTLTAGQTYLFNMTAAPSSGLDCWVEVHDASGTLLAYDDDGGPSTDSSLQFLCTVTGTYYVSAQAYHDSTQSSSGGYTLTSGTTTAPNILDSINWGTQVANPANITVYFAASGESFGGYTSQGWNAYQEQQAMLALQQWANVANLTFSMTSSAAGATLKLVTTTTSDFLGEMFPPGEANAGVGIFASNGQGWATGPGGGLEPGGQGFATLVHEFGHALGLAHPHDNGGTSTVMQRVLSAFGSFGLYDLDQGVFTTMSYNRGWQTGPNGIFSGAQYDQATPMALDIALVQQKYGANLSYHTGNDVYLLPTSNTITTDFQAIWDAGGADTIAYNGSSNAHIDLTAATIDYSPTGGGVVSYVDGIFGGFTIAKGVVIENATGGSGNDTLNGNAANNVLDGGPGGLDHINGGAGSDTVSYASSTHGVSIQLDAQVSWDGTTMDFFTSIENAIGSAFNDTIYGDSGNNTLDGGSGGVDVIYGGAGSDTVSYASATHGVSIQLDTQVSWDGTSMDFLNSIENAKGSAFDDYILGSSGDNVLAGGGGNDTIIGGGGFDTLSLSGNPADYHFTLVSPGLYTVTDAVLGRDGIDVFSGIEQILFGNGSTLLVTDLVL